MVAAEFQALLDAAVDAIIVIDERGQIMTFNRPPSACSATPRSTSLGKNVKLLMSEPHRSQHDRYIERYLTTGESHIIGKGREVEGRRANGETFPVVALRRRGGRRQRAAFRRHRSRPVGATSCRATGARRWSSSSAHVARFNLMGEMAAGIAHEINQPLSAIATYAQAAQADLAERRSPP